MLVPSARTASVIPAEVLTYGVVTLVGDGEVKDTGDCMNDLGKEVKSLPVVNWRYLMLRPTYAYWY